MFSEDAPINLLGILAGIYRAFPDGISAVIAVESLPGNPGGVAAGFF